MLDRRIAATPRVTRRIARLACFAIDGMDAFDAMIQREP